MNSFELEYVMTETEQVQFEQRELQTVLPEAMPASAQPVTLEETRPASGMEEIEIVEVESFQQNLYELSYSCLLIPRFSDHYLTGDITSDLPDWVRQICISYGWRLDDIMVRPGHLHWVMTVPITVNPAQFMRLMRQLTSQKIFEYYPRYARKNVSSDFWAPAFLVAPGKQFQSMENINAFILQTRRQQGIY
ncbi:MAG: transposase [Chloroflexi bacterium]|nr:transposase [Chloroflexota bacterium]